MICNDKHCPKHAKLPLKGMRLVGTVISAKAMRTAKIEIPRLHYLPKFERYEKRRTKLQAHKPDCIDVKVGDKVEISECRPISKTKKFVIVKNASN